MSLARAPARLEAETATGADRAAAGWRRADIGFAVFVIFISSNAFTALGLHAILWAAAYAYALARILMLPQVIIALIRANWIFLAYPAACAISLLWSPDPAATLRFSAQLVASTAIAFVIGRSCPPALLCRLVVAVLVLLAIASLINLDGSVLRAYDHRGNFVGIFESKNALGHRAVMLTLSATALVLFMPAHLRWRGVAALGLAATLVLISRAGSATAVLLCALTALLAPALYLTQRHPAARAALPAMVPILAGTALAGLVVAGIDPLTALLEALNRDATLTGRTLMWAFGVEAWMNRPLLGHAALGIWNDPAFANRILAVQAHYGAGVVGFHNLTLELLVMLGPLGLLLHSAALVTAMARSARLWRSGRAGAGPGAWALTLLIALVVMAQFGPQLHNPHGIPWILVTALAVAIGPRAAAAPRARRTAP
ncbi:MAG: O-antigen ligase family protein [Pseudomonadota bacterium]